MSILIKQFSKNFTPPVRTLFLSAKHSERIINNRAPLTILSEDEKAIQETVSKLAKEQIEPHVRKMEKDGKFKESVIKMLFENGLMGLEVDTQYGGSGCNFMSTIIAIEEISKVDPAVAMLVAVQNSLINSVIKHLGTEEQKKKYLPQLSTNLCGSFALTEAASGSDAFVLKATATKDGFDYILNGSKMWISHADVAGLFLVMANADTSKGYRGITCFLVDRNLPGITVATPEKKLGICASATCLVNFDNVRVPHSEILSEVGQGYKIAARFLNGGRICTGAQMLGLAEGCFDSTIPYTLERTQSGQPIFTFQSMQHQIAQIATQIECARLLVYNAARLVEQKAPFVKQASMAKYYAAEVAQQTCIKCIDWMGGVGCTKDFVQEKFYRDVKIGSIYEGTYNIQLSNIAKHIEKEYNK